MNPSEQAFLAQVAIGVFSIDESGQIWRHRRLIAGSRTGTAPVERDISPRRAETTKLATGHLKVQVQVGGKKMMIYAHRVVWMLTNQADIPAGMHINHRDGVPGNNRPSNLELVTPSGNTIHAMKVLGKMRREGTHNSQAKLTEPQAREILSLCEQRAMPQRLIALQFGVSVKTVQDIFYRRHWKHLA